MHTIFQSLAADYLQKKELFKIFLNFLLFGLLNLSLVVSLSCPRLMSQLTMMTAAAA